MNRVENLGTGDGVLNTVYRIPKDYMIAALLETALFIGVLTISGSLWSGYHLVDDHTNITILEYLNDHSMVETMKYFVISDLHIRFRPLYYVILVIKTALWGLDMYLWMLFTMFEGIITFMLLYHFAKEIKRHH